MLAMAALDLINSHLQGLLVGDYNPPDLTVLFHLRGTLIWWMHGLLEPRDWNVVSFLPVLRYPGVLAALCACGFISVEQIPPEALPHPLEESPPARRA